jgi:hypothetical protein
LPSHQLSAAAAAAWSGTRAAAAARTHASRMWRQRRTGSDCPLTAGSPALRLQLLECASTGWRVACPGGDPSRASGSSACNHRRGGRTPALGMWQLSDHRSPIA